MDKFKLNETLVPLDINEWDKLNQNWDRIKSYLRDLQRQLSTLSGGEEVTELLNLIDQATQDAIEAEQLALTAASEAETAKLETETATTNANNKANLAQQKADLAQDKIDFIEAHEQQIEFFTSVQTNLQAQINQLVADGDSSPEAAQARVGSDDTVYSTLKARLDDEHQKVTQQLAQNKQQVSDLANELNTIAISKAEKLYVEERLESVNIRVDGIDRGYGGTYSTLTELQTAFPTGDSKRYVVSADGNWYYWNESDWISGGIFQSTGYADGSVTPDKTSFISTSTNIVDLINKSESKTIKAADGTLDNNSKYDTTDFLTIEANSYYTFTKIVRIAFYNANREYITSELYDSSLTHTKLTPESAKYIRFVIDKAHLNTAQCNKGTTLLPYESWKKPKFKKDYVDLDLEISDVLTERGIKKTHIDYGAVGREHLDFLVRSTNLYNDATAKVGYTIEAGTGEELLSSKYTVSDFIQVKPLIDYVFNGVRYALYEENKNYITTALASSFTTTAETYYVRVVFFNTTAKKQLNEGATFLEYEEFYENKIPLSMLPINVEIDSNLAEDYYVLDSAVDLDYTAPDMPATDVDSGFNWVGYRTDEVYAQYDSLVSSYPDYVTKTLIGTEATGLEIYKYTFNPSMPNVTPETKFPKIILLSGTHFERTGVMAGFRFFEQLCTNWENNELLELLRWNVEFYVVPVVNPWGVNNSSRKNSNGVDINRNFPSNWENGGSTDPTASTYRGTEPLSELEAQYIHNLIQENNDALLLIDFHNFSSTNNFLWTAAGSKFTANIGKAVISKMTRKWKSQHPFLPQDNTTFFGYSSIAPNGSTAIEAEANKIRGVVFEIGAQMPWEPNSVAGTSFTYTKGVEALTYFVGLALKETVAEANRNAY